jgi:hypothetical protein
VFVDPQGASIGVWQSFAKKEEPKPAAAPAKKPAGKKDKKPAAKKPAAKKKKK